MTWYVVMNLIQWHKVETLYGRMGALQQGTIGFLPVFPTLDEAEAFRDGLDPFPEILIVESILHYEVQS